MKLFETQEVKDDLIGQLKNNIVSIKFKKANGEIRNMSCTLMEKYLPKPNKDDVLSIKKMRTVSPEVLCVWDIEKNYWRSMRWENILEINENDK